MVDFSNLDKPAAKAGSKQTGAAANPAGISATDLKKAKDEIIAEIKATKVAILSQFKQYLKAATQAPEPSEEGDIEGMEDQEEPTEE
jgi:hypothetical protein